jgi:regulator of sigma E protease
MILSILQFLGTLLLVVVVFNLLIIVHELGHFLAARWRGLAVEQFGIWFGKEIWKTKINGVVYSLGCIPAGGFVKLPQLGPMEVIEGRTELAKGELPPVSALDKVIVAFAGPLFSFLLAAVFAVVVWAIGKPTAEGEMTTVIGWVEQGSPAEKAGLQPGDRILEVDGAPVARFAGMVNSVAWHVVRSERDTIRFKVDRGGETRLIESGWVREGGRRFGRSGLRQVQMLPKMTPVVGEVEPDGPAFKAGVQPGDIIAEVNGTPIYNPVALAQIISENPDKPVTLGIDRNGGRIPFEVRPVEMAGENGAKRPRIGIVWDLTRLEVSHPSPSQQLIDSCSTIFNMMGALFSPKSDVKAEHFSGPVGIMRIYVMMFNEPNGWLLAIWFSVVLNVNLALLNLLPIPVLDGGHIVLAVVEGIRRKPVNPKIVEWVSTACALLLIGFMLYVTFFDVRDLLPEKAAVATPAPAAATPSGH